MEELEEMKEAFDNLTKSALQLNEMYKKKSKIIEEKDKEIERLTKRLEEAQLAFLQVDKEKQRLNNIINNIDKKCKYLLENEKVIINEKTYYKQKCDDIITNFIYEELKGSDKE